MSQDVRESVITADAQLIEALSLAGKRGRGCELIIAERPLKAVIGAEEELTAERLRITECPCATGHVGARVIKHAAPALTHPSIEA